MSNINSLWLNENSDLSLKCLFNAHTCVLYMKTKVGYECIHNITDKTQAQIQANTHIRFLFGHIIETVFMGNNRECRVLELPGAVVRTELSEMSF